MPLDPRDMISGPGWFKDIFRVDISVDGEGIDTESIPKRVQQMGVPSARASVVNLATGVVSGSVLLTPPPGRTTVNHLGVDLQFVSILSPNSMCARHTRTDRHTLPRLVHV